MTAQIIELASLAAGDGFTIQADDSYDRVGTSVSNAGDINGDGIDDFLVGVPESDDGGYGSGSTFVIFGKSGATRPDIDLASFSAADGFRINGQLYSGSGRSVSAAGDVNGDGFDDLIIGAPDNGYGSATVIFGRAGATRGEINIGSLSAQDGFSIRAAAPDDFAGGSVSGAGDINGDGIDDLIIGARGGDNGGSNAGEAYVIFGKTGATRASIDLITLSGSDGFIIQGDAVGDLAGISVSAAGDVNNDGVDDLIVGAINGDNGGSNAGEAYVIFGRSSGGFGQTVGARQVVDLSAIDAATGFIIQGGAANNILGFSVSDAGDVNGDGIDDLIVGATNAGSNSQGAAYVLFGKTGATGININLATLAPSDGFAIVGRAGGDSFGYSVSTAGDVNGDGFADLIVGATNAYGDDYSGEAYVIFGKSGATRANIDIANLSLTDGLIILGVDYGARTGSSVSGAGDINGDGFDDLIVGAPRSSASAFEAGEAYIIYGKASFGAAPSIEGTAGADTLTGTAGDDTINGGAGDDVLVGGAGSDAMNGGTGNDIFVVTDAGDVVNEAANEGRSDSVETNLSSYTLPANVENLEYTGAAAFTGTGNAEANHIVAGSLDDTLNGGDGDDTLAGEAGNDTLNGGNGADRLFGGVGADIMNGNDGNDRLIVDNAGDVANGGDGIDTVEISASLNGYTVAADVEIVRNISGGELTGQLNALANTYGGSNARDFVGGGAGNDSLYGRGGGDNLFGEDGNDFVYGEIGNDTLNGGNGTDRLYGGADNDILLGEAGNDTIYGDVGNDQLFGGAGFDILNGGASADLFGFNAGDSSNSRATADRVQDFSQAQGDKFAISAGRGFIGTADFSGSAGEIRYAQAGGNTFIEIDIDGNGVLDEIIRLDGLIDLTGADFLLR